MKRDAVGDSGADGRLSRRQLVGLLVCLTPGLTMASRVHAGRPTALPKLPEPRREGTLTIERVLRLRRSVRDYASGPLSLAEVSQLLWAAQGVTHPLGLRTAPSAGALYPLETYLVAGAVTDLPPGVYRYDPRGHGVAVVAEGDRREALSQAALGQTFIAAAAATLVITAVYQRTTVKYGERGRRYVHMEAGHTAQNIYLQAGSLGLGTVAVGAFEDERVRTIVGAGRDEQPLYVMPIGRR